MPYKLIVDPTDQRLYVRTKKVKAVQSTECLMIVQAMAETIRTTVPNCVGLAAPQIGANLRIIFARDVETSLWYCFVNPRIVGHSDIKVWGPEGCLSHPGLTVDIARYDQITVVASDPKTAKEFRITFRDDDSQYPSMCRIIQHEIDHLERTIITMKGEDGKNFVLEPVGQMLQMQAHKENLEHGYQEVVE